MKYEKRDCGEDDLDSGGGQVTPGPRLRLRCVHCAGAGVRHLSCVTAFVGDTRLSLGQVADSLDTGPHTGNSGAVTSAHWSRVTCYEL